MLSEKQWRTVARWVEANEKPIAETKDREGLGFIVTVVMKITSNAGMHDLGFSVYRGPKLSKELLIEGIRLANSYGWTNLEVKDGQR